MLRKALDGQKIPQDMRPRTDRNNKDILAMAGPMMPPGGAPPSGGGDIANQLMQLIEPILASPKGQMMAQALMQQMQGGGGGMGGQVPQNMPQSPMIGRGTDMDVVMADQFRNDLSGGVQHLQRPPMDDMATGESGPMPDPRQTPMPMSTEDEMGMVQQMMGGGGGAPQGGGGGINQGGPTPQEVQMLKSNPSPRNQQNFDKLFGPGAAQQALGGGGGGSSYEEDVRAAMQDSSGGGAPAEDDSGDDDY